MKITKTTTKILLGMVVTLILVMLLANISLAWHPKEPKLLCQRIPNGDCGEYILGGSIIIINSDYFGKDCKTQNYDGCLLNETGVVRHETRHFNYFNMPLQKQRDICKSYGLMYKSECWERYANEINN